MTTLKEHVRTAVDRYAAQWDESKHPRASDGRFGTKAGDHGGENPSVKSPEAPQEPTESGKQPARPAQQPAADKPQWRTDSPQPDFNAIHKAFPPADVNGKDTEAKYKMPDGRWTQARQKLHDDILDGVFEGVKPSDNPTVYMMGGGPASGKSSIVKSGAVTLPEGAAEVDPDAIKGEIPEYQEMVKKSDNAANYAHEESSYLAKAATARGTAMGADIVMDGTGDSGIEKLRQKVAGWRKHGHRVVANYVTVDTDEAVRRAMARAEKTGRKVPESVIRSTHAQVSAIFPQAVKEGLFDEVSLYDTGTGGEPVLVAQGHGSSLKVHDQEAYKRFLAKANA